MKQYLQQENMIVGSMHVFEDQILRIYIRTYCLSRIKFRINIFAFIGGILFYYSNTSGQVQMGFCFFLFACVRACLHAWLLSYRKLFMTNTLGKC